MRVVSAALAMALTPAFVALPIVTFDRAETPHPVAPKIVSTAISGVDQGELTIYAGALAPDTSARTPQKTGLQAASGPVVITSKMAVARFTVAGVSWSRTSAVAAKDVSVNVRVNEDSGWTAWETLATTDDGPDTMTAEAAGARVGTTPLVSGGATGIQVRVDTATGVTPADLKVSTIEPGTSPADDDLTRAAPAGSASAVASQPAIITRAQWGADEKLRKALTYNTSVKAITIHHTAGSNTYTQADAAAQVRGIYAYDTLGLGWADIAYNFLVDKWGRVYEGRAGSITSAVRGAHAMGFNVDTMGVSAMGNYETTAAPAVMVDAMARVAGWKLSQYGANPLGKVVLTSQGGTGAKFAAGVTATLDTIHAHQNSSYTLCPGKYLYPQMGAIRAKAATYATYSSTTAPAPVIPKIAGFDADGRGDVMGRTAGGGLYLYPGRLRSFSKPVRVGSGWNMFTEVLSSGDFTGDGKADLLGRTPAGALYLYRGNGMGGFAAGGKGIGSGWNMFNTLLSPGDFTGDGKADLLGRTPAGALYLYPGNGTGAFATSGKRIGRGWNIFNTVISPGDLTGDRKSDLLARRPDGRIYLYAGNGKGGFAAAAALIPAKWGKTTRLFAVR